MFRRAKASTDTGSPVRAPRGTGWPMLFAALAGGLSLFSFSPFNWWPLQFVALAFLFYQVGIDLSVRRSTLIGWAFGFGWSIASMHWLYITMNRFGNIPGPMAVAAVCLLGAYMGLFSALATGVATWFRRRWSLPVNAFLLLVLPVMWGLTEWMRGWLITGFPWGAAGYAHTDSPLTGYAPLVGVYGLGALVALGAACLVLLTQRARKLGISLLALLLAVGYGLGQVEWTRPHGQPISVRLLQGNVPQQQKFSAEHIMSALDMYRAMITQQPADLIALPETAFAVLPQQLPPGYLPALTRFSAQTGSHLLFGIAISDRPRDYTNSVAGIAPSGQTYRFDKHHLVPFGEFVPPGFRWFVDMMRIPLGDMTRGAEVQAPFAVKDQLVLPNVCYEDVFGEEIALQLRSMPQPATMLLNASNLAWFGESVAIPQHLQISRMRSIETGRPMLRATNTGATAVIDGRGKVVSQVPNYTHGALATRVQGMQGLTPYIRFGNYLFLALAALGLGAAWLWGRRARKGAK